jgi:hypothetical protein
VKGGVGFDDVVGEDDAATDTRNGKNGERTEESDSDGTESEDPLQARPLLPAEERDRAEFTRLLANAIDKGRSIGIEVDFLNPLTETMKRLSENAITYQPTVDVTA